MTTTQSSLASLLQSLRAAQPPAAAMPPREWLWALRTNALEHAGVLQLPTSRDEAWRLTDVTALGQQSFLPLHTAVKPTAAAMDAYTLPEAGARLVFVDGVAWPDASHGNAFISTLSDATGGLEALLHKHLGQHARSKSHVFSALNTAFLHDAAVLVLPRDTVCKEPIHVLYLSTRPEVATLPRLLVVAEPGSRTTLVEDHVGLHTGGGFTNAVAELVLGAQAHVTHVRVQRESPQALHLARAVVTQGAGSHYHSISVALGARTSRLELEVLQAAEGTHCQLDALTLVGERQLADTHTFIDHAHPHGTSRQLHKCIVGGAAHTVFNGKVMVRPGAQKADSAQSSRNLLLSPKAWADTQPQLEILADDVRCTHGATVGQLDAEELFYLQSRGLSISAARQLLSYAFGAEVLQRIPVASLRQKLEQAVLAHTAGAL